MSFDIKYKKKFWPIYKTLKNVVQFEEQSETDRCFCLLNTGETIIISRWNSYDAIYPREFSEQLWKKIEE